MDKQPSAVMGSTRTVRTLVDGGMSITIDIQAKDMQAAFALFGTPGTPVAIARVTAEASRQDMQRGAVGDMAPADFGKAYAMLYRAGWWHNPRVAKFFKADQISPENRPDAIKAALYREFAVETLAVVDPKEFREWLALPDIGLADTLPRDFP